MTQPKAGKYRITALFWEQITSKPGQPLDFVRHAQGSVVDLDDAEAARLVAAKAAVPADASDEDGEDEGATDGTIAEVLAEVGDDPEKAAAALEAEKAGKNRSTLIGKLEAIVAAGTEGGDES